MTDPDDTVRSGGEPEAGPGTPSAVSPPAPPPSASAPSASAPSGSSPSASALPGGPVAGQPSASHATGVPRQAEKETAVSRPASVEGDEEPTVSLDGRQPVLPLPDQAGRRPDGFGADQAGRGPDGFGADQAGRGPDGFGADQAGRGPDGFGADQAGQESSGGNPEDEPTVSLAGRSFSAVTPPAATPPSPAALPAAEVPPAAVTLPAPEVPPADAVPPSAASSAGSPVGEGEAGTSGRDAASDVPEGDLDLGVEGPEGAGETSAPSPDPSISVPKAESDLGRPARRRPAPAGTLIWVLLALLGFTLVVQLRSNDADEGLSAMRQEDLVRILSDLEAQDSRLLAEIQALEQSKQQLNSEVGGKEAAQAEALRRSQDLGLLAGTERGTGPGLDITLSDVSASDVLNTVQELRGAGGEVMQLNGANGREVRVVASSFFVDATGGGIIADGEQLTGPYHLLVIGPASTMSTALQIPGGVVASAKNDGGSVTMDSRSLVEVTAVRKAAALRYARPVS
jgi:uncharacterized protein YlxW (UPF0749 family)